MKWKTKQVLWIVVYFILILAPLVILLLAPRPAGRTFWRELSVAFGFVGLALMGLQFIPTARLPFLSEVFPLDTLYNFHHRLSIIAFGVTLAHPVILFIQNPYTLKLLNVFTAPWRAQAAVAATVALILLVVTSVKRLSLRLSYEAWRTLHDVFAVAIVGFALYHIFRVNYYTSVSLQRWLWVGLGIIWGLMMVYIRILKPLQLLRRPYEVVEVISERGKAWSLILKPVGHAGHSFRAGQVAWLSIGHSPFLIEEHPFSYATSDRCSETVGFAIKELGNFTATIGSLQPGTKVYIDGPYGTFDLDHHPGRNYVFIAGGIGSAPIMSMLRTLADRNDERQLQFFYGNPTYDDIIFREELESLQQRLHLDVIHVLEKPSAGWEGETGYITKAVLERHLSCEYQHCTYFICGPLPMIESVERSLLEMAVSRKAMHEFARKRAFEMTRKHIYSENYKMA
ncbi:MAG: ferric reductase-like transmembrane domain-containing protein [Anaerolineae bacterium]|nr:ferric reductase-like transmembrane domain-containing protein [Anaerolineae bacterium]